MLKTVLLMVAKAGPLPPPPPPQGKILVPPPSPDGNPAAHRVGAAPRITSFLRPFMQNPAGHGARSATPLPSIPVPSAAAARLLDATDEQAWRLPAHPMGIPALAGAGSVGRRLVVMLRMFYLASQTHVRPLPGIHRPLA